MATNRRMGPPSRMDGSRVGEADERLVVRHGHAGISCHHQPRAYACAAVGSHRPHDARRTLRRWQALSRRLVHTKEGACTATIAGTPATLVGPDFRESTVPSCPPQISLPSIPLSSTHETTRPQDVTTGNRKVGSTRRLPRREMSPAKFRTNDPFDTFRFERPCAAGFGRPSPAVHLSSSLLPTPGRNRPTFPGHSSFVLDVCRWDLPLRGFLPCCTPRALW